MKPWHDCPQHDCNDGTTGPVTPIAKTAHCGPNDKVGDLLCAACGYFWTETDVAIIAKAWWSAGAYEGAMESGGRID